MDGIQSWSTFEQQQQQESKSANYNASSATATTAPTGINALYVSSGSSSYENKSSISPAASALLRQAALTATVAGGNQQQHHHNQDDQEEEEEDEFRLKFHWIRPHPAVVLALEDEWHMGKGSASASANDDIDAINNTNNDKEGHVGLTNVEKDVHPAVETSRLMDVYRYGQWNKGRRQYTDDVTANNDNNGVNNDEDDNDVGHLFQEKVTPANQNLKEGKVGSPHNSNNNIINANGNMLHNLPLELPKLRINLASLVEPSLLSSWLPGEDTGISYEGEETREPV